MEQLLPYYESELAYLRRNLRDFAERYPKIAGRLLISGEVCEDPHTERMIESFALLNARIAKRLDDDYPEFTEALFEVLYPHYLRPFPSCSIARMDVAAAARQQTAASMIARGTQLTSRPVRGVACTFRTVYPVAVAPLALQRASFSAIIDAPDAVRLPAGASSSISFTIAATGEQGGVGQLGLDTLRVFIDGEPSFCAALRVALFMRGVAAYAELQGSGRWVALPAIPVKPAGFGDDEALIDFPARSHTASPPNTSASPRNSTSSTSTWRRSPRPCRRAPVRSRCTWPCRACAPIRTWRACWARSRPTMSCWAARRWSTCSASAAIRSS